MDQSKAELRNKYISLYSLCDGNLLQHCVTDYISDTKFSVNHWKLQKGAGKERGEEGEGGKERDELGRKKGVKETPGVSPWSRAHLSALQ